MRYGSLFLIGTLVFIVSCSDNTVTTGPTGPEVPMAAAANVTTEVIVNQPFDLLDLNPCANDGAGELIEYAGFAHIVSTVVINGNRVVLSALNQFHLSGVGVTTGDKYQVTQAVQFGTRGSLVNGQLVEKFVGHATVTGPGPGNNMYFPTTIHITVNANGEVTAEVLLGDFVCK
jgi:hypothetical protein